MDFYSSYFFDQLIAYLFIFFFFQYVAILTIINLQERFQPNLVGYQVYTYCKKYYFSMLMMIITKYKNK